MTYRKSMHKAATSYRNLCINPTESAAIFSIAWKGLLVELQLHDLLQAEATHLAQVIHLRRQFNLSAADLSNSTAAPPSTAASSTSTGEDPAGPSASGDVAGSGADSTIVLDESEEMSAPNN